MVAPLDSASSWLTWSNVVYVGGAVLTLAAAMHVLYEKRAVIAGRRTKESFISEALVILAATVSLAGTIGAIHFGNVVSKLKDDELAMYKKAADLRLAELATEAEQAKKETAELSKQNKQLGIDLSKEQTTARKQEGELKKQTEGTIRFAQALAVQQQTMARQIHASPELDDAQVDALAKALAPFKGQELIVHTTVDTVVQRLGASLSRACDKAGIVHSNTTDFGVLYQGVTVAVHAQEGHPQFADVLVIALREQGIVPSTLSLDQVPEKKVAVYLGPQ